MDPTSTVVPAPTLAPYASVRFRISTFDGGAFPPTARLCIEGPGVDICEPITPSVLAFAAQPRIVIVETSAWAITVEVRNLPPGAYLVRLTGLAPYADITATLELAGGAFMIQPIVLSHPALPPQVPDGAASPTVEPGDGAPPSATPTPTGPLVTHLPSTGTPVHGAASAPFALMLLTTLLLLLAAARLRRGDR